MPQTNPKPDVTRETLLRLFAYDPLTGVFIRMVKGHGGHAAGTVAGTKTGGYLRISIRGRRYHCHTLAWLAVYNYLPKELDHINRDRSDNRIENLRVASRPQNCANRPARIDSGTGIKGVYLVRTGKYVANITKDYVSHHLGTFDTVELAALARAAASKSMHGEFAGQ